MSQFWQEGTTLCLGWGCGRAGSSPVCAGSPQQDPSRFHPIPGASQHCCTWVFVVFNSVCHKPDWHFSFLWKLNGGSTSSSHSDLQSPGKESEVKPQHSLSLLHPGVGTIQCTVLCIDEFSVYLPDSGSLVPTQQPKSRVFSHPLYCECSLTPSWAAIPAWMV